MARMSSSRMTRCSAPSILTSVPAYLLKRTMSPTFTAMGTSLPSSACLPGPTATTSPLEGFSLAVSGMYRPLAVRSSDSRRFTRTRSFKGFKLMTTYPPKKVFFCCNQPRHHRTACGESLQALRNGGRVPDIAEEAARFKSGKTLAGGVSLASGPWCSGLSWH